MNHYDFYKSKYSDEKALLKTIEILEQEKEKISKKVNFVSIIKKITLSLMILGTIIQAISIPTLIFFKQVTIINSYSVINLMITTYILFFMNCDLSYKCSKLNESLEDLNDCLVSAETRYNELINIKTNKLEKTNKNVLPENKKEVKCLKQIFNEIPDEELTLEIKPKVRTRK